MRWRAQQVHMDWLALAGAGRIPAGAGKAYVRDPVGSAESVIGGKCPGRPGTAEGFEGEGLDPE